MASAGGRPRLRTHHLTPKITHPRRVHSCQPLRLLSNWRSGSPRWPDIAPFQDGRRLYSAELPKQRPPCLLLTPRRDRGARHDLLPDPSFGKPAFSIRINDFTATQYTFVDGDEAERSWHEIIPATTNAGPTLRPDNNELIFFARDGSVVFGDVVIIYTSNQTTIPVSA